MGGEEVVTSFRDTAMVYFGQGRSGGCEIVKMSSASEGAIAQEVQSVGIEQKEESSSAPFAKTPHENKINIRTCSTHDCPFLSPNDHDLVVRGVVVSPRIASVTEPRTSISNPS